MREKATGEKGIVVNVTLPRNLVVETDHCLADLPHIPRLLGGRRSRSTLIQHLLRFALPHQEEVLAEWKPSRNR